MGQPRRLAPKWSPGFDIGYTFRSDGFIPPPAIKALKDLPEWFMKSFNEKSGAHLFCRDRNQPRTGVAGVLEALRHYHKVGAFKGVRVRTPSFSFLSISCF
jgi:hypothetical protein